jgi:hypothetical protein
MKHSVASQYLTALDWSEPTRFRRHLGAASVQLSAERFTLPCFIICSRHFSDLGPGL